MSWNVLLTSYENKEKDLLLELAALGKFERSGFRNTLVGSVESVDEFLEELKRYPSPSLSRVAPIERWFESSPSELKEKLKDAIRPLLSRIAQGESFCVRVERRGLKGILSSKELEVEIGSYIWEFLKGKYGFEPKANLTDPDKLLRIETLGNRFGIGIISKEMRENYPLVR